MDREGLISAALLGVAAGVRSITPVAVVSWVVAPGSRPLRRSPLAFLSQPAVRATCAVMVAAEAVADKLPITPARTAPGTWLGRVLLGGLAGAAISAARDRPVGTGMVAGAGSAGISTYVSYRIRMALIEQAGLPNVVAGSVGDLAALALSLAAVSREPS